MCSDLPYNANMKIEAVLAMGMMLEHASPLFHSLFLLVRIVVNKSLVR